MQKALQLLQINPQIEHSGQPRIGGIMQTLAIAELFSGKRLKILIAGIYDGIMLRIVSLDDHFAFLSALPLRPATWVSS